LKWIATKTLRRQACTPASKLHLPFLTMQIPIAIGGKGAMCFVIWSVLLLFYP